MGTKEEEEEEEEEEEAQKESVTELTTKTNESSSLVPPQTRVSSSSTDIDAGQPVCRVCHCTESDLRGDTALTFLGITPPIQNSNSNSNPNPNSENKISSLVEFKSPKGEIFLCNSDDLEAGPICQNDILINLGCSCKNELSLTHYACALKWFINHGSTNCEICGTAAQNILPSDFKKVLASIKDYEELRENAIAGELHQRVMNVSDTDAGVDPDAIAGIRRQRLSEISSWFNTRNSSSVLMVSHEDESYENERGIVAEGIVEEREARRFRLEGTGVFVATGLVMVILAWLIAPHVGKRAAIIGVHLILGGLCGLTLVMFLRFVIGRVKFGPTRHWVVSFVFLFLIFGVWISRTRNIRTS